MCKDDYTYLTRCSFLSSMWYAHDQISACGTHVWFAPINFRFGTDILLVLCTYEYLNNSLIYMVGGAILIKLYWYVNNENI